MTIPMNQRIEKIRPKEAELEPLQCDCNGSQCKHFCDGCRQQSTTAMTRAPLLCSQIFDPTLLDNGPDLGRGEDRQRRPNSLHRTGRAFWFKAQLGWLSA
jgi:hypothetical protein